MLAENEEAMIEPTKTVPDGVAKPEAVDKSDLDKTGINKTVSNPETGTDKARNEEKVIPADLPKKPRRKGAPTLNQVIAWFSACARCSYFLSGYRTLYGNEDLDMAVGDSRAGWLSLKWDRAICKLLNKTYGSRFDGECYYYDGICPDCRRHFSLRESDTKSESTSFRIEIKPRTGR